VSDETLCSAPRNNYERRSGPPEVPRRKRGLAFEDGFEGTVLRLVDKTAFGSGVVVLTYRSARDEGESG
jgi:hypothetical protein